jgi:hypothetical protein
LVKWRIANHLTGKHLPKLLLCLMPVTLLNDLFASKTAKCLVNKIERSK